MATPERTNSREVSQKTAVGTALCAVLLIATAALIESIELKPGSRLQILTRGMLTDGVEINPSGLYSLHEQPCPKPKRLYTSLIESKARAYRAKQVIGFPILDFSSNPGLSLRRRWSWVDYSGCLKQNPPFVATNSA